MHPDDPTSVDRSGRKNFGKSSTFRVIILYERRLAVKVALRNCVWCSFPISLFILYDKRCDLRFVVRSARSDIADVIGDVASSEFPHEY